MNRSFGGLNTDDADAGTTRTVGGIQVGALGGLCVGAEIILHSPDCLVSGTKGFIGAETLSIVCLVGAISAVFEALGFSLPLRPDGAILSSPALLGSLDLTAVPIPDVPGESKVLRLVPNGAEATYLLGTFSSGIDPSWTNWWPISWGLCESLLTFSS